MARRKRSNSKKRGKKQRNRRKPAPRKNEELRGLLDWFLGDNSIFSKMKLHGNAKWVPERLVCLALIWAWAETRSLVDSFEESKLFFVSIFHTVVFKTGSSGFSMGKDQVRRNGSRSLGEILRDFESRELCT